MTEEKSVLVERAEAALSSLAAARTGLGRVREPYRGRGRRRTRRRHDAFRRSPARNGRRRRDARHGSRRRLGAGAGRNRRSRAVAAAVAAEDAGPTLSSPRRAPTRLTTLGRPRRKRPNQRRPQARGSTPPPRRAAGAVAAAEAEDLTAHASSDDSAPVASAEPAESRREPVSLADLARASIARRGSAEKASIAKESLAVASQSRAQGDQIAQRVQAAASYRAAGIAERRPAAAERATRRRSATR